MHIKVKFRQSDQRIPVNFGLVHNISDGGYERGLEEGKKIGYENGHKDGETAGYEAAMEAFGYAYQHNLKTGELSTNYYQRFVQGGWTDQTFAYIKYPIICKGGSTNASSVFTRCEITHIDIPITIEGIKADSTFYYATYLESIADLTFINVTSFSSCFTGCTKLKHIGIKGSIDVNFNISATSVLTNESVQSIIDHLKDLTGQTTQTLTFHATVGAKLTEEQKAAITAKNWTLAY